MDNFLIGQKIVLTADARFAPFKCPHCPKLFINQITLDKHWIKHHPHTYDYQNGSLFFQDNEFCSQSKKEIYDKNNILLSQIGQYRLDKLNLKAHSPNVVLFSKKCDSSIYKKEPISLIENNANPSRQNISKDNLKYGSDHLKKRKSRSKVVNQSTNYSLEMKSTPVQTEKTTLHRSHCSSIASNTCKCCFETCNLHFQDNQKSNNVMCKPVNNFISKCDGSSQTSSYKNTFISNIVRTKEASTITKPENTSTQTYSENIDRCTERKDIIIRNYIVQTNIGTQTSMNRSTNTHSDYSEDEVDFYNSGRPQLNISTQTKLNESKMEEHLMKKHFNAKIQTISNEDKTSTMTDGSCFNFKNTVLKCNATTQTVLKKNPCSLITEDERKSSAPQKPISQISETTQTSETNKQQFNKDRTLLTLRNDSLQINTTTQTLPSKKETIFISEHERNTNNVNKITQTDIKTNKKDDTSTNMITHFSETLKKQEHSISEKKSIYVKEQTSQVEENVQKHRYFVNTPSEENKNKINRKHWDECIQACLDKYDNHSFDISAHNDPLLKKQETKHEFPSKYTMCKKWDEYTQTRLDKQGVNFDAVTTNNESFIMPNTQCSEQQSHKKNPNDECIQTCLDTNENQTLAQLILKTAYNDDDKIEKHSDGCTQFVEKTENKEIATRPETQSTVYHKNDAITAYLDESIQTCSINENQIVKTISANNEQTVPKPETNCKVTLKNDTKKEHFDECIQTCLITNENQVTSVQIEQSVPKQSIQYNDSLKSGTNKDNIDGNKQTCIITNENQMFGAISAHDGKTIPNQSTQLELSEYIQNLCANEKNSSGIVAYNEQEPTDSNKSDTNKDNLDKCVQICFDTNINISSLNNKENKFPETQVNINSNCNSDMLPKSVYTLANLKQFEITNQVKKLIEQNEMKPFIKFQSKSGERSSVDHTIKYINIHKDSSSCGGDTKASGAKNKEVTNKSSTLESSDCEENSISEESYEQKSNDGFNSNKHTSLDFNNEQNYGNISLTDLGTSANIVKLSDSDEILPNQQQPEENYSKNDSVKLKFDENLKGLGIGPNWKLLKDETMQKSLVLLKAKRIRMKKSFSSLREKIRSDVDWLVKEKMRNKTIK